MPDIKKNTKFKIEQDYTLNVLLDILENYTKNDKFLNIYDMDNDYDFQNKILTLKENVKKYYSSSTCNAINNKKCTRPYLILIKYILKHHNYELQKKEFSKRLDNNTYVRTTKYFFYKK